MVNPCRYGQKYGAMAGCDNSFSSEVLLPVENALCSEHDKQAFTVYASTLKLKRATSDERCPGDARLWRTGYYTSKKSCLMGKELPLD